VHFDGQIIILGIDVLGQQIDWLGTAFFDTDL
jgi:hypothetical protein